MISYDHGGDIYGNPGITLDYSVNTNPFGMPPEVTAAVAASIQDCSRYPDTYCRELVSAIARDEGVPEDYVLCGNGAADLIYRLCYALRLETALLPAPTFSEYGKALSQAGAVTMYHDLSEEGGFRLDEGILDMIKPGVSVIFLCQPNNPTGRLIPDVLLKRILERAASCGIIVVVDECFLDFTGGKSAKPFLRDMPSVVILKAFTKIYAMAGLRLGYILCSDRRLVDRVYNSGQCWSVSVPAQAAGIAALKLGGWKERTRELVRNERVFLADSLCPLGITVYPGDANFLLIRADTNIRLYEDLLEKGILIRRCGNFCGLTNSHYRLCVKERRDNERLIDALKEILHG